MIGFFRVADTRVKLRLATLGILSLMAVLTAFIAIRFVLTSKHLLEVHAPASEHDGSKEHAVAKSLSEQEFTFTYEIKDMSVGFINRTGNRTAYAQFSLVFDCENEECVKNLSLNRAKLLDAIYQVSGNYYIEDFTAPLVQEGFKRFKLGLLQFLKKNFPGEVPRQVIFRDWFMN